MARVKGLHVTGVERQPVLAELARANLSRNDLSGEIVTGDIAELPQDVKEQSFDHVILNPPFFDRKGGSAASDKGREGGRGENTPLAVWLDIAIRRLAPKGCLAIIQRSERLPDVLGGLDGRVGDICIQPLSAREGRMAELFVTTAKKGARGPFRLAAPVVLHEGHAHEKDGDSYSEIARKVLREGLSLREAKLSES